MRVTYRSELAVRADPTLRPGSSPIPVLDLNLPLFSAPPVPLRPRRHDSTGRDLLGNRSHEWLDTVASFGLDYERALGPAGHLKDEAGWLGVKWLSGPRSTEQAVVQPSRACRSPRCHRRGDRTRPRVGPAPSRSQVRAFLLRMIAVRPVVRAPPAQSLPAPPRRDGGIPIKDARRAPTAGGPDRRSESR